jgi:hypothetical protein
METVWEQILSLMPSVFNWGSNAMFGLVSTVTGIPFPEPDAGQRLLNDPGHTLRGTASSLFMVWMDSLLAPKP